MTLKVRLTSRNGNWQRDYYVYGPVTQEAAIKEAMRQAEQDGHRAEDLTVPQVQKRLTE